MASFASRPSKKPPAQLQYAWAKCHHSTHPSIDHRFIHKDNRFTHFLTLLMHYMTFIPFIIPCLIIFIVIKRLISHRQSELIRLKRDEFIRQYQFKHAHFSAFEKKHPQFDTKDTFLIAHALREYFLMYNRAGQKIINMPAQSVDDFWHIFILDTHAYNEFCKKAFGKFFHHTPTDDMAQHKQAEAALMRAWKFGCLQENISLAQPTRLPLLFAIDGKLQFPEGHTYDLQNMHQRYQAFIKTVSNQNEDSGSTYMYSSSSSEGSNSYSDSSSCDSSSSSSCGGGGCGGGCGGGSSSD